LFLQRLATRCRFTLVSYVPSDGPRAAPRSARLQHGWVTHCTHDEFQAEFTKLGFRLVATITCDAHATRLWLWASPGATDSD
jgi:hypothetical protein